MSTWRSWSDHGLQRTVERRLIWYVGNNWSDREGWVAILFLEGKVKRIGPSFESREEAVAWADALEVSAEMRRPPKRKTAWERILKGSSL